MIEHEHGQVVDAFAQIGTQTRVNDEDCESIARYKSRYSVMEPPEQTRRRLSGALERIPALPSRETSEDAAQGADSTGKGNGHPGHTGARYAAVVA